jgi:hypothetical protein
VLLFILSWAHIYKTTSLRCLENVESICLRVLLCIRHLLYDSCTTLALRRSTQPSVGLTKFNAASRPFDSTSYTNRKQMCSASVFLQRNLWAYDTSVSDVHMTKIERAAFVAQARERFDVAHRTQVVQKLSCI